MPHDDTDEPPLGALEGEALLKRFRAWFRADQTHSAQWRKEARQDYDYVAGKQWSDRDKAAMEATSRVPIVFNRMLSIIKSVAGSEINNRQEIKFLPRELGDAKVNEVLTAGSKWLGDECDAEDEQSEAFEDCAICGMGWTESRLDLETDPEGKYVEERVDPLEMYWDASARKKNISDAARVWRVRKVALSEARAMFPQADADELDAKWVYGAEEGEAGTPIELRRLNKSGVADGLDDLGLTQVTLVQLQYWERAPFVRMLDPQTNQTVDVEPERFAEIKKVADQAGVTLRFAKLQRRVYRQAFIGGIVLEHGDAPDKEHFTFQCITGERDRNAGTFFGLARVMRDPQMWANKWLSQTLHIMNTSAKGGILAEKTAFDNQRQAEDTYARNDAITWLKDGALSGQSPKLKEKPVAQFPAGFWTAMEFAISSIRDVSGINLELLGMRDANQPGILEAQRKQAAMTILATLFNSLRRYRKQIGRIRLYFIQNHLSDGRLIRIVGQQGAQIVPLVKDRTIGSYDVVVDDAPTSPNQKEATWNSIVMMLPALKGMLTPQLMIKLAKYSPLPESLISEIEDMVSQAAQQPDPAMMEMQMQMALDREKAQGQLQIAREKMQGELAIKQESAALDSQLNHEKAVAAAHTNHMKAQSSANGKANGASPSRAMQTFGPPMMARQQPVVVQQDTQVLQATVQALSALTQQIAGMRADMNAPKRVLRDSQNGQVIGIEPLALS